MQRDSEGSLLDPIKYSRRDMRTDSDGRWSVDKGVGGGEDACIACRTVYQYSMVLIPYLPLMTHLPTY